VSVLKVRPRLCCMEFECSRCSRCSKVADCQDDLIAEPNSEVCLLLHLNARWKVKKNTYR
jgi:hypothetical protein